MQMWLKILIEVPLAIFALAFGQSLWSMFRLMGVLVRELGSEQAVKVALINGFNDAALKANKLVGSKTGFAKLMYVEIQSSNRAWRGGRNLSAVLVVVVLTASWFLDWHCLVLNTILVWPTSTYFRIPTYAHGYVVQTIQALATSIYNWLDIAPEECRAYCRDEQPKLFDQLCQAVEELRASY